MIWYFVFLRRDVYEVIWNDKKARMEHQLSLCFNFHSNLQCHSSDAGGPQFQHVSTYEIQRCSFDSIGVWQTYLMLILVDYSAPSSAATLRSHLVFFLWCCHAVGSLRWMLSRNKRKWETCGIDAPEVGGNRMRASGFVFPFQTKNLSIRHGRSTTRDLITHVAHRHTCTCANTSLRIWCWRNSPGPIIPERIRCGKVYKI